VSNRRPASHHHRSTTSPATTAPPFTPCATPLQPARVVKPSLCRTGVSPASTRLRASRVFEAHLEHPTCQRDA
jgi:hypothetical protein